MAVCNSNIFYVTTQKLFSIFSCFFKLLVFSPLGSCNEYFCFVLHSNVTRVQVAATFNDTPFVSDQHFLAFIHLWFITFYILIQQIVKKKRKKSANIKILNCILKLFLTAFTFYKTVIILNVAAVKFGNFC